MPEAVQLLCPAVSAKLRRMRLICCVLVQVAHLPYCAQRRLCSDVFSIAFSSGSCPSDPNSVRLHSLFVLVNEARLRLRGVAIVCAGDLTVGAWPKGIVADLSQECPICPTRGCSEMR
jgi:hypothetical protein